MTEPGAKHTAKGFLALRCLALAAVVVGGGCTQVNEVDLSRIKDFQWNQRVRVVQVWNVFRGGFQVNYIELESEDGVKARLQPANGSLRASVTLNVLTTRPATTQDAG